MNSREPRLLLFFSRAMSLGAWARGGTLERELALYRRLAPRLGGTGFLSYGKASEREYVAGLDGIEVLYNRWNLPRRLYPRLVPLLFARSLSRFDVFKTNQTDGAELAITAKRVFGKKLIARCGYMWSANLLDRAGGEETDGWRRARRTEHRLFNLADRSIVTTEWMRRYVVEQYGVAESKVSVIPNYVLTDVFKPEQRRLVARRRICFVGRLEEAKDPLLLLEAMKGLNVELDMIGDGKLRPALEAKAAELGISIRFLGIIPHNELPTYLNSSAAFALSSRYENHPKALLEAMACGLPVIGTNVRGIRDVIQHGVTGYLCDRSPEGVRHGIRTVLGSETIRARLGRNAREFAVQQFDIDRIVELELELLRSLLR